MSIIYYKAKDDPEADNTEFMVYHSKMREMGVGKRSMVVDPMLGQFRDKSKKAEEPPLPEPDF
jgi:hypothetical protein